MINKPLQWIWLPVTPLECISLSAKSIPLRAVSEIIWVHPPEFNRKRCFLKKIFARKCLLSEIYFIFLRGLFMWSVNLLPSHVLYAASEILVCIDKHLTRWEKENYLSVIIPLFHWLKITSSKFWLVIWEMSLFVLLLKLKTTRKIQSEPIRLLIKSFWTYYL